MMNSTMSIRISPQLKKDLDEISRIEHKPVSDLVRESLEHYLALRRFRSLRNTVLPFAEAAGILTDEDVFREVS
jgi:predicted transcriptional regulator